jgi:hypothetical protein
MTIRQYLVTGHGITLEGKGEAATLTEKIRTELVEKAKETPSLFGKSFRVNITEGDKNVGAWTFKAKPRRGAKGGKVLADAIKTGSFKAKLSTAKRSPKAKRKKAPATRGTRRKAS